MYLNLYINFIVLEITTLLSFSTISGIYLYFYMVYGCLGESNGTPLQYSCLENPMDGGAWQAAVHGVARSWTGLSDFTFTFHCHALEKEMATHSIFLAWRLPGTGEPGGLPCLGSQSRTRLKRLSSSSSSSMDVQFICSSFVLLITVP